MNRQINVAHYQAENSHSHAHINNFDLLSENHLPFIDFEIKEVIRLSICSPLVKFLRPIKSAILKRIWRGLYQTNLARMISKDI